MVLSIGIHNQQVGEEIIAELIRQGVDYFSIAPGSRSTSLVAAVARNPQAQKMVGYDERGVAFHALGYARGAGRPACVITTSGTAVANLFPAVVEASEDGVPMLLLTADRPASLRGTGANQTINQVEIFGMYVRGFWDLDCSDSTQLIEAITTSIQAAAQRAVAKLGPVHINCQFAKPFLGER